MAYYNNVPKNVKARTILKTGTLGEWELASNFIPLKGEPVIVQVPQQYGPGWYYNATEEKYYSNSYQQQAGSDDPIAVEAQVITETKKTDPSDTVNNPFYYIADDSATAPIIKTTTTGTYADYPVDKYGYFYTITSKGYKEYCEIVNWDFRVGDGINKVIDLPKFVEPEIKDNEWYIGGIRTGVSATPNLEIKNGQWWINGVNTNQSAIGSTFAISKVYYSIEEMNEAFDNKTDTDVPLFGLVIINVPYDDTKPDETGVNAEDTAKLFVRTTTGYEYITDLSGAQGIQGLGIKEIQKTSTSENIDTYTVYLTNNEPAGTFTVTNGTSGTPGENYDLTEEDKQEIADLILAGLDKWQGGSF